MLGAASGTFELVVGWGHVYFHTLADLERGGSTLEVEAFCCRCLQVFAMGTRVAMKGCDRDLDGGSGQSR